MKIFEWAVIEVLVFFSFNILYLQSRNAIDVCFRCVCFSATHVKVLHAMIINDYICLICVLFLSIAVYLLRIFTCNVSLQSVGLVWCDCRAKRCTCSSMFVKHWRVTFFVGTSWTLWCHFCRHVQWSIINLVLVFCFIIIPDALVVLLWKQYQKLSRNQIKKIKNQKLSLLCARCATTLIARCGIALTGATNCCRPRDRQEEAARA